MSPDSIIIAGPTRTPQGNLLGELKDVTATQLGSAVIQSALTKTGVPPQKINDVFMGCVLPAGLGQAPARQAALNAGLPHNTQCVTLNKVCGSGMQAVIFAHDLLLARKNDEIIIAGGMENMTNAPYMLTKARQGYRLGHFAMLDHMMFDGLEDAYDKRHPMGYFAEICAKEYGFSREQQDQFAIASLERAQKAIQDRTFLNEITPIKINTKQGEKLVNTDEHPLSVNINKIPQLPPVFMKDGTVTAANSSSIADGAAVMILMRGQTAKLHNIKPIAQIVGHSTHAKSPSQFTTAPVDAIKKLLNKLNWFIENVDLFEINEAFAVVTMAAMRDLNIPHEKLNIHGGGCALGHPIGATGARIIVTLIHALIKYHLKRGIAALCIGGGEATAIAVEIL
jgi:acetyl-CoA C-acetyltransferase